MSGFVNANNISEAWIRTLGEVANGKGNRRVHLVTAIANPVAEVPAVREVLDEFLSTRGKQSVTTVAETIFPSSMYRDPGFDWEPGLSAVDEASLDEASAELYCQYIGMLPLLLTVRANRRGTYFSRMVTWPGKLEGGTNQLALRVLRLRSEAQNGRRTLNTLDVDIGAAALDLGPPISGLQVYEVDDTRTRGFPCLTHVDLTLFEGVLHCTAVYRHQYLIEKAYGNLVGLGALMQFLCQQGGCELGELVVHATLADSEVSRVHAMELLARAEAALEVEVDG